MHVRPIQQCPNCLKTKLNPAQYSEQSSRSAASPITINRKCKIMDHESEGQMHQTLRRHGFIKGKNGHSLCSSRKDNYIGAARYCGHQ